MKPYLVALCAFACCWSACEEAIEGCVQPRAVNFDPEADVNANCIYYQLELQWQHYSATQPNDTLLPQRFLTDAAGDSFFIESCRILGSKVYLTKVGDSDPTTSPESLLLSTTDNGNQNIPDNFFGIRIDQYAAAAGGWIERGDFDRLTLQLGLDTTLRGNTPQQFIEGGRPPLPISSTLEAHPFEVGADPFLYDSINAIYPTLHLTVVQPDTTVITVQIDDVVPFSFPYVVTAKDGENVPIRLRLDYDQLLQGIRWNSDSSTIANQLSQKLPLSLSTY